MWHSLDNCWVQVMGTILSKQFENLRNKKVNTYTNRKILCSESPWLPKPTSLWKAQELTWESNLPFWVLRWPFYTPKTWPFGITVSQTLKKINKNKSGNPYIMMGKVSKTDCWVGKRATVECVWPNPIYVKLLRKMPPRVYRPKGSLEAGMLSIVILGWGGSACLCFYPYACLYCIKFYFLQLNRLHS